MTVPPSVKPSSPAPALLIRLAIGALGIAWFISQARGPEWSAARVGLLAPGCFFWALWSASNALFLIGRGDDFGPQVVSAVRSMGIFLMIGAFCAIVVQPALLYLAANGFTELRGASFDLSVENITIALVGIVLVILVQQVQKLKSKLEEFV